MPNSTATLLEPDLQKLIDARLDTIDRMLMGRVPRTDRQAIIKEVESQIEELLSEKESDALGPEEILELLARLDPPEAYLVAGDPEDLPRTPLLRALSSAHAKPGRKQGGSANRLALAAGIVGILSLLFALTLPLATYLLALALQSEGVLFGGLVLTVLLGLSTGIFALVAGTITLSKGAWPIVGIVTAALAVIVSLASTAFMIFIG